MTPLTDAILIQDLKVHTIIGVLPFERHQTQLIVIDACLFLDLSTAGQSDSLEHSIDYSQVALDLECWTKAAQPHLLETLAETLCTQVLKVYPCQSIMLTLTKPGALPNAKVSVRLTRQRLTQRT